MVLVSIQAPSVGCDRVVAPSNMYAPGRGLCDEVVTCRESDGGLDISCLPVGNIANGAAHKSCAEVADEKLGSY